MMSVHLSILLFRIKNKKKHIENVVEILSLIFMALIVGKIFNYFYFEPDEWSRILWYNFYEQDRNIDNIYLGSSCLFCDIDPTILDCLNGENNFNLATSGQLLNGTYYLLREANRTNNIKRVYVELNYDVNTGQQRLKEVDNLISGWRNTDYMQWSLNRLEYMLEMSYPFNYVETFAPFYRFRKQLFDADYLEEQMHKKQKDLYKSYHFIINDGEKIIADYRDKGYYYSEQEINTVDLSCNQTKIFEKTPMNGDAEKYLRKIIEYCIDNNLELTLFCSPINDLRLISLENYDAYVEQIKSIASEYSIDFYDFNLCKEKYFPIQDIKCFMDMKHLNGKGAEKFTRFFYKIMNGNEYINQKYFYLSYKEKLICEEAHLMGIIYLYMPDSNCDAQTIRIASNRDKGVEYRILLKSEAGDVELQDYSENKEFSLPLNEKGSCIILARSKGGDVIQTLECMLK